MCDDVRPRDTMQGEQNRGIINETAYEQYRHAHEYKYLLSHSLALIRSFTNLTAINENSLANGFRPDYLFFALLSLRHTQLGAEEKTSSEKNKSTLPINLCEAYHSVSIICLLLYYTPSTIRLCEWITKRIYEWRRSAAWKRVDRVCVRDHLSNKAKKWNE